MSSFPRPRATVIAASSRLARPAQFVADWVAETVRAPRFAWQLFRRSLNNQFRHSAFGLWLAFAPATITALVFAYGRRTAFFDATTGGVNSAFFSAIGMLMAQAFIEAFQDGRRLFVVHQGLLRRHLATIEAPLLATVFDCLFRDLIRVVVMAGLFVAFGVAPTPALPLAVWGLAGITFAGLGIGLLLAPPSALYPELSAVSTGLPLVLFTVTPVFTIPAPDSSLGRLHAANPLSALFEGVRAAAYGGPGALADAAVGPLVALLLVLAGWFFCRVARPHLVERMLG